MKFQRLQRAVVVVTLCFLSLAASAQSPSIPKPPETPKHPVTDEYQGSRFFIRGWKGNPGLYATPLFVVLIVIETTDFLFAVDSIPAVLAVTLNAFIVYTSIVFAILGLRSMYFAVAGLMKGFRFLHHGLALVLILVGLKMISTDRFPVSTLAMLGAVARRRLLRLELDDLLGGFAGCRLGLFGLGLLARCHLLSLSFFGRRARAGQSAAP